jgi:hypothetical protein
MDLEDPIYSYSSTYISCCGCDVHGGRIEEPVEQYTGPVLSGWLGDDESYRSFSVVPKTLDK